MQILSICFCHVDVESIPVWYTCEEGTYHLDVLEDEQDDPQHCVHLDYK